MNTKALMPRSSDFTLKGALDPREHLARTKEAISPAAPKVDKEAAALQAQLAQQQANDLANLNDEENKRIKKLLLGRSGVRGYRGSPLLRAAPGNSAGGGRASSAIAGGGGTTATASAALRSGGARGGTSNSTFRAARQ